MPMKYELLSLTANYQITRFKEKPPIGGFSLNRTYGLSGLGSFKLRVVQFGVEATLLH